MCEKGPFDREHFCPEKNVANVFTHDSHVTDFNAIPSSDLFLPESRAITKCTCLLSALVSSASDRSRMPLEFDTNSEKKLHLTF